MVSGAKSGAVGVPIGAFEILLRGVLEDSHEGRELTDDMLQAMYQEFVKLGFGEWMRQYEVCSRCGGHVDVLQFSSEIYGWHHSEICEVCGHGFSEGGMPSWMEMEDKEVTAYGIRDEYGGL